MKYTEGDRMMGKLYIVPTPIGNLKDMTLRGLEALKEADFVAAEDTRQTLKLLNHFGIKKSLISYHQHNENGKSQDLIDLLEQGKNIALVSDAGTPGISDPGCVVIRECIKKNLDFEVLPGATAITTAVVNSGLDTTGFTFKGFLPRENKDRTAVIEKLKDSQETLIFYEAPHRLLNTLQFLLDNLGNRRMAACRELTKMHEEIYRNNVEDVIEYFKDKNPRGEFVLVVEGKTDEEIEMEHRSSWENMSITEHIQKYIDEGLSKKEAVKKVAKDRNMQKSEVYKYSIEL